MATLLERYRARFDTNQDGKIDADEMTRSKEILEMELREEKQDAQRRMSWTAIATMIVFTIALFTPLVTDNRVNALADLLGLFYVAQASIVGFYFGASAFMSKK